MVTAVAFIGVLEHRFHTVNPGKEKPINQLLLDTVASNLFLVPSD